MPNLCLYPAVFLRKCSFCLWCDHVQVFVLTMHSITYPFLAEGLLQTKQRQLCGQKLWCFWRNHSADRWYGSSCETGTSLGPVQAEESGHYDCCCSWMCKAGKGRVVGKYTPTYSDISGLLWWPCQPISHLYLKIKHEKNRKIIKS